jgi:hypothetical protein
LHAVAFGCRQLLVEFVELGGDDVFLLVDAEDAVLFLIANQLFLRFLNFHLQFGQLLGEPVGGSHGGIEAGLVILLDVGVDQRVDRFGGETGIGAGEPDFEQSSAGDGVDLRAP